MTTRLDPSEQDRRDPLIETVVVQPTPFCNINCSYCYLPSRDDRSVIALPTVRNLFEKLFASGWTCPRLTVIWHAGEPLVVPLAFYREAFALIEALRPEGLELVHSFQTNGMLLTPEWCDFITAWNVDIGVSIDGPRRLHDRHRVTRSGRGTFDRTLAGIRLLRARGIAFHTISVLGRESLDAADELYDFFVAEGIEHVCFNIEESEGQHVSELLGLTDLASRYRLFLEGFWQRARAGGRIGFLREIDQMITTIFRPNDAQMRNSQVEPLGMLNVDCRGNVSTFSPELLGYRDPAYGDFLIGNIDTDSFAQLRDAAAASRMCREIAAGVAACRDACDYFSICGGGAPVNKLSENGSFAGTRTRFCALTQIIPADIVLASADNLAAA